MGYYINHPEAGTTYQEKCNFIKKHYCASAIPVYFWRGLDDQESKEFFRGLANLKRHIVVVVDNGAFAAAAIAYSLNEFRYLIDSQDKREKTLFVLPENNEIIDILNSK